MIDQRRAEILQRLEAAFDDVHRPIREGFGLSPRSVDILIATLGEFRREWEDEDVIPKRVVSLFVATCPALQAASDAYSGPKAAEISDAADMIFEAIDRAIGLSPTE